MYGTIRFAHLAIALILLAVLSPARVASAQEYNGIFQPGTCMFDVPAGLTEGRDLECGYLTVPERHDEPDGPTIQLAVAIIRSTSSTPAPDPLVMLQGGPGGSTIDTYSQVIGIGRLRLIRAERDIVLFDQRGTLYSIPALTCPEQLQLVRDTIEQRLNRGEANRLSLEATQACHTRLVDAGIDLADYNSLENAADVNALRMALGYTEINLYGVSYGTLLALHTMREHPDGLRSVILDAVVPTQTNFITQVPRSQDRAFSELFAACAADKGCNVSYPNLEQVFFDLVATLNQQPARVPMTDPESDTTYNAVIDGDTLQSALFQLLYASEIVPALPHVIYRARDGDFAFFSRIMPQIYFDRTFAYGMYQSVICAEDADFAVGDVVVSGIRPEIAEYADEDAAALLESCANWDVPELDAPVDRPVVSDIPTLVLNGRFDPITPPINGEEVARTLSRSYVYTFGTVGHGAATTGACPESIIAAFLNDPENAPDARCIAESPAPEFVSSSTVRFAPGLVDAIGGIDRGELAPLIVPVVCLAFLLSLYLVWPLAWLVRVVAGKPAVRPVGAMLARGVATLITVLGAVFVVGLVVLVFQLAFAGRDLVLLFGVPASTGWLLVLPWAMAVAALAMLACTGLAWLRRYWSVFGRMYYTMLAFAAAILALATTRLV